MQYAICELLFDPPHALMFNVELIEGFFVNF